MTYEQLTQGQAVTLESGSNHSVACCDCGLVHRIQVTTEFGGKASFTLARDGRATAGVRRGQKMRERLRALVKALDER